LGQRHAALDRIHLHVIKPQKSMSKAKLVKGRSGAKV